MKHLEIYAKFKVKFENLINDIVEWFSNGKNSIRVRSSNGSDFIFTYHDENDWCFETIESYLKKMKGGHTMNVGLHDNSNES